MAFPCSGCGLCCGSIRNGLARADDFRGHPLLHDALLNFPFEVTADGACSQYRDRRCAVYPDRPLICRVDRVAEAIGADLARWYDINAQGCNHLIREAGLPETYLVHVHPPHGDGPDSPRADQGVTPARGDPPAAAGSPR